MSKFKDMTMPEIKRLTVIGELIAGEISTQIASFRLGISTRQVRRLVERSERVKLFETGFAINLASIFLSERLPGLSFSAY